MAVLEYTHSDIGQSVEAISGHYTVDEEIRLVIKGRTVLCIIMTAIWDRSCMGPGGLRYALVPGYLVEEKKIKQVKKGRPVSIVETINDLFVQEKVKKLIDQEAYVQQVNFW